MNRELTIQDIQTKILRLPDRLPFMLDQDIAEVYGVSTGHLNQAVHRNKDRFPADFRFKLTSAEVEILRSQNVTLKQNQHDTHVPHLPWSYTRMGCNQVSNVLKTRIAAERSVLIIRAFSALEEAIICGSPFGMDEIMAEGKARKIGASQATALSEAMNAAGLIMAHLPEFLTYRDAGMTQECMAVLIGAEPFRIQAIDDALKPLGKVFPKLSWHDRRQIFFDHFEKEMGFAFPSGRRASLHEAKKVALPAFEQEVRDER